MVAWFRGKVAAIWFDLNLRKKFSLLFLLTAVMPLLFTTFVAGVLGEQNEVKAVFEQNQVLANNIAKDVDQMFSEKINMLEIIANTDEINSMHPDAQSRLLKVLADRDEDIHIVLVADLDGNLITRSDGLSADALINYADREYFQTAQSTKKTAISDTLISRSTGKLGIVIAAPIKNDAQAVVGFLIANIGMDRIVAHISQISIGKTGYAFLVNAKGLVLLHPQLQIGQDISDFPPVKAAMSKQTGWVEYEFEQQKQLAGFSHIGHTGWGLVVQQPFDEAMTGIWQVRRVGLLLVLLTAVLAGFIGIMKARALARPITAMSVMAENLAAGKMNASIWPDTGDELGQLAFSFNNMALQLQKRESELRQAYEVLEVRVQERTYELELLNEKLERLSLSDGLTGIANRRYFDDFLAREWGRAKRDQTPISLLMLDVDNFKLYNDTYGHIAGDECLKKIATILGGVTKRSTDLAARYGGEEFALILPNTTQENSLLIGNKILASIEELRLEHSASSVSRFVTVSIGSASFVPTRGSSPEIILLAADQVLYQAKQTGRNQLKWNFNLPTDL